MVKIFSPTFFGLTLSSLPQEEKRFDLEPLLEKKFQPLFPNKRIGATPLDSLVKKIALTVACYFLIVISFGLILKSTQFENSFLLLKKNIQVYADPSQKTLDIRHKPKPLIASLMPIHEEGEDLDVSASSHHTRSSDLDVLGEELDDGILHDEADGLSLGHERPHALHLADERHILSGSPTVLLGSTHEVYHASEGMGRHPTPSPTKQLMVSHSPIALAREAGVNSYSPHENMQSSPIHFHAEDFPNYGQPLQDSFNINFDNALFKTILIRSYNLPQAGNVSKKSLSSDTYNQLLLLHKLSLIYSELSPCDVIQLKTLFLKGSVLALYNEQNYKHWKKISVARFNDLIVNPSFAPCEKDLIAIGDIVSSETKFVEISRFITHDLIPSFIGCHAHLFNAITENARFFNEIENLKERQAFGFKDELSKEMGSKTLDFLRKIHSKEHFFSKFFEIFFAYKTFIGEEMTGQPTQVSWIKLMAIGQFMKACNKL
jgi:hypothetical protein